MNVFRILAVWLFAALLCVGSSDSFAAGKKLKNAVDPDCTVGKAAKGAATKAVVGIGNRCDAAETARDVTGVDDRVDGRNRNNDKKRFKKKD